MAESIGSLPPGLWLTSPAGWLQRTGISSALGSRVWATFTFLPARFCTSHPHLVVAHFGTNAARASFEKFRKAARSWWAFVEKSRTAANVWTSVRGAMRPRVELLRPLVIQITALIQSSHSMSIDAWRDVVDYHSMQLIIGTGRVNCLKSVQSDHSIFVSRRRPRMPPCKQTSLHAVSAKALSHFRYM